jgi:serine/threonine-protein kinase
MTKPMEANRWREVDDLFRSALELPSADRRPFVAARCAADPELREAVESLLAAAEASDGFLESPIEESYDLPWHEIFPAPNADDAAGADGDEPAFDRGGDRVGPYRIERRIGRGGMASVYLAWRVDGGWRQQVAIKLLNRGLDTEDLVRRFIAERQILSSLSHPNIARLLDGGATDDGLPYLVMDWVDGISLVRYCDERRLTISERLRLFCEVGRAVQHAHRRLVVHRDLKPSNIMVDTEGRVKLLDFGIARVLADPGDATLTRPGFQRLTPAYASPEQVLGGPITTASDIYQLGLLLCELVVGRLPYGWRALTPAGAERAILEAEAARPSSLVTPAAAVVRGYEPEALSRRLRGDLDSIVIQALKKDPEERYTSVEAMIDDVERHRRGEPVVARPLTPAYRFRKFFGRHRLGVAAAAAFVLLLAGSAFMAAFQAHRLARERDRALTEEARAERVTAFLTDLFRATDPNELGGESVTALELLDAGADRALRDLEEEPSTQAEVLSAIGSMYVQRGLWGRATPILERAVELRREGGGQPARRVLDLRRLAEAVVSRDRDRAVGLLEEAVSLAERELGPRDPLLAAALIDFAETVGSSPQPEVWPRADSAIERALTILRDQKGDVRGEMASALHLSALGKGAAYLPRLEEALRLRRSLYGDNHTAVAATLNDMALVLEPVDPHAADTLLERAAAINAAIHGPDHAQTLTILNNLAGRYRDRGDFAKAEPLYRELLHRRRAAYPADSLAHAYSMHGLGWALTELGRADEAEPLLREAFRLLVNAGHDGTSMVHHMARSTLGRCLTAQGRYAEAEPLLSESYEWAAGHSPDHVFIPFMLDRLIGLYDAWPRPQLAAEYRRRLDP